MLEILGSNPTLVYTEFVTFTKTLFFFKNEKLPEKYSNKLSMKAHIKKHVKKNQENRGPNLTFFKTT